MHCAQIIVVNKTKTWDNNLYHICNIYFNEVATLGDQNKLKDAAKHKATTAQEEAGRKNEATSPPEQLSLLDGGFLTFNQGETGSKNSVEEPASRKETENDQTCNPVKLEKEKKAKKELEKWLKRTAAAHKEFLKQQEALAAKPQATRRPSGHKTGIKQDAVSDGGKSAFFIPEPPPPLAEPDEKTSSIPLKAPPIKVTFSPDNDMAILKMAGDGAASPMQDLFLHRQALALLLAPGFETLLSLNAARDIQLLDYQLATVRHVLKNLRGRALLCDEVGLGKTIEAGLIMLEYLLRDLVRRVLILTPPSLVEQWRTEMHIRFNLDFTTYDAPAFKSASKPWTTFPRIIASIDTAKRTPHKDMILDSQYDMVIVDEAHHLKNKRTLAHQLVSRLKKKYILLLTATPVENNLDELFNLITLLQPGHLDTAASFKKKYVTRGDPLKPRNPEHLKKLVREVMVRNRRSQTGVISARRHAEIVEVTLSPEEMAFYRRLTSFIRGHYSQKVGGATGGVNQFVLKTLQREVGSSIEAVLPTLAKIAANENNPPALRHLTEALAAQAERLTQRAKAGALVRLLEKIQEKALVFTSFRKTQRFLADMLRREGLEVAELHGGMRRAEKEKNVQSFYESARVLVSTENGSEGRNLQFCNIMINYDLPWNPMRIEQRIGRIHRLGQTKDVYIYNLSAAGTVEAHILELLDAKINMFQLVIGELDMILGNLHEKRDFEDMIMDIWTGTDDDDTIQAGLDELGERLASAKNHYLSVKELDDKLLGELLPEK